MDHAHAHSDQPQQPKHEPDAAGGEPDVLDDPLLFLERFAIYLRDRASKTELVMAGRWAATLIQAVELGSWRHAIAVPASVAVGASDLARWARTHDEQPRRLIVP